MREIAHNYATHEDVPLDEAVEWDGRWFIKPGFAGYNSRANNLDGYASKAAAKAAVRRYQSR